MENDHYYEVYRLLVSISRGKVTTYGAIAGKLGLNPRYVGTILSENSHPEKYPCYKVVRSDGTIGGYTIGKRNDAGTSENKRRKLIRDGVLMNGSRVREDSIIRSLR